MSENVERLERLACWVDGFFSSFSHVSVISPHDEGKAGGGGTGKVAYYVVTPRQKSRLIQHIDDVVRGHLGAERRKAAPVGEGQKGCVELRAVWPEATDDASAAADIFHADAKGTE